MRDAFKCLAHTLRKNKVEPANVDVVIRFRDRHDRNKIAFALGKEMAGFQKLSGIPEHVYVGDFYNVKFELREHDDA